MTHVDSEAKYETRRWTLGYDESDFIEFDGDNRAVFFWSTGLY
jgi:hypothetical protein